MIREWTIYKIISPSNKIYIGVTSNYRKRYNYYKNNNSEGQKKLSASFNKHGFENHTFEIIDTITGTLSQALSKEMFWIRTYMSNCVKYPEMKGLNLTDGGQGTIGYKATDELRKRLSDYHKANPSKGMLGKKHSPESIAKVKATKLEQNRLKPPKLKPEKVKKVRVAWNKGIPILPHVKEALMLANKNKPSSTKGKNYSHLTQEERDNKFGKHNIGNTYNKGRKHSVELCKKNSLLRKGRNNPSLYKKIVRYNTVGELIGVYK